MNVRAESGRFLRIEELHAFISIDSDGHEGIIGVMHNGEHIPLICADPHTLDIMRHIANDICKDSGLRYEARAFRAKELN